MNLKLSLLLRLVNPEGRGRVKRELAACGIGLQVETNLEFIESLGFDRRFMRPAFLPTPTLTEFVRSMRFSTWDMYFQKVSIHKSLEHPQKSTSLSSKKPDLQYQLGQRIRVEAN